MISMYGDKLVQINAELRTQTDKNSLLEKIVRICMEITHCDAGTLYLLEDDKLNFSVMLTHSMGVNKIGGEIELPAVEMDPSNVCAYAVMKNEVVNIEDVDACELFKFEGPARYDELTHYKTVSMMVMPLQSIEGDVIGAIQLINAKDEEGNILRFDDAAKLILQALAAQAAVCLGDFGADM